MLDYLMSTGLAQFVSERAEMQQLLETIHMLSFSLVIGAIVVMDLRILGVSPRLPLDAYSRLVTRLAYVGFAGLIVSGAIMFLPRAEAIFFRTAFQVKMGLIVLSLLNLIWLQGAVRRLVAPGLGKVEAPGGVKAMAGLSILLWVVTIIVARFMYAIDQVIGAPRYPTL
jgi:hypothetical protein